jgi:microsomal dipeptidase-like Zn-dependent dipeptidase
MSAAADPTPPAGPSADASDDPDGGMHVIADLHCHYPMHLLPEERDPQPRAGWLVHLRNILQAAIIKQLAKVVNDRNWSSGWRVSLKGLEEGGAGIVCSVIYWPPAEFDFARPYGSPPLPAYFEEIEYQLGKVEDKLESEDPARQRLVIAKRAQDFDSNRIVFVHCVEGGFQLGPDEREMNAKVRRLAEQGVFYITVAHLFYRGVATNAPSIPDLSDKMYNDIFHQPKIGLTSLGEALVRAMHRHKVVIDITHMREDAIQQTFALVEDLDRDVEPERRVPVIAGHVGMRDAGPDGQEYNLSADTARRIHRSGGLIGLISAQQHLGKTATPAESQALLAKHLDAIKAACGDHEASALGTDIDGFVKPTLEGFETAADMARLAEWISNGRPPDEAEKILYGNARRVIKRVFELRA